MKKKPIQIDISDNYIYPKKTLNKYSKDLLYKEKSVVLEQEFILNRNLSIIDQANVLRKYQEKLNDSLAKLEKDFAIYKLFRPSSKYNTDEALIIDFNDLDKYIQIFKEKLLFVNDFFGGMDLSYKIKGTNIPINEKITSDDLTKIYEKLLELFSFINGLNQDLNKIKKEYFHEFKLTSFGIVRGKTTDEIYELIHRVSEELSRYRSLTNARDYMIYNSGFEIQDFINEMLKLNDKYTYLTYHYFLNQDAIIAFTYNEWVEFFIKVNYVLDHIDSKDKSNKLMKKYNDLLVRYTILLIDSER